MSFDLLCREIRKTRPGIRLEVIDSSPRRLKGERDPLALRDAVRAARILLHVGRRIRGVDGLVIFGSNGLLARLASIFVRLARLAGTPCYLRAFGGSLDRFCADLPSRRRARFLRALRNCEGLIVQTRLLQRELTSLLGRTVHYVPGYRSIPPPVENRPSTGTSSRLRLVFLGHVREEKGVFVLLESLRILAADGQEVNCDVFGPVYDGVAQRFEAELRDTVGCRYRGILPQHRVTPTLASYDVLVFPTHYQGEGHPGVVIEAMMAGLPVITTNFRSLPEIVEDGVTGLLVPPHDPHRLTAAIRTLSRDRERLEQMAVRSRARANRFDVRAIVPQFLRALGIGS